jgi:FdhD protein
VDTLSVPILRVQGGAARAEEDLLVVEEPLEIRLGYGPEGDRRHLPLSVTMRTPGSDLDLAAGFLFTEGIIRGDQDLWSLEPCGPLQRPGLHRNGVRAELQPDLEPDLERLERHFYTTSSCGVCGKTSLESLEVTAGTAAHA